GAGAAAAGRRRSRGYRRAGDRGGARERAVRTAMVGDRLAVAGHSRYRAILSNPPLHAGVAEDHGTLQRLIRDSPARLERSGVLQIVVQRRIKAGDMMREAFGNADVVAEDGRYRVLRSVRR
ncbi:MAG: methyltransferase, partial [Rhodospirillales bacterium]|nr:methyltransferase [Rhodospirillales bacterium]